MRALGGHEVAFEEDGVRARMSQGRLAEGDEDGIRENSAGLNHIAKLSH
jgi:hypothetical protein